MNDLRKESVTYLTVDESGAGQRVDNFLARHLKGVPKSHLYRILRSGEVRVNKGRCDASRKLVLGDEVRIPPIRVAAPTTAKAMVLPKRCEPPGATHHLSARGFAGIKQTGWHGSAWR